MRVITLRRPDDMHVHLRQGEMLENVLPYTAKYFARALVMPNTEPPIVYAVDVIRYYDAIQRLNKWDFYPYMTIKLVAATTPRVVEEACKTGHVMAAKLYPEGVTTNSADGISDFRSLWPVLAAMQDEGLVLSVHGEMPGVFCMDREVAFLDVLTMIREDFPNLRIVLEHISTAAAAQWVNADTSGNTAATITVHHLLLTLDDVVGGMLHPHHFCKPIAKRPEDRARLLEEVLRLGQTKFFLGPDSAPHDPKKKECRDGCAGVFSAPVILPLLAEIFVAHNALAQLEAFTSVNGANFYELPLNEGTITLREEAWTVPPLCGGVVPFKAGETLAWQVED